MNPDEQTGLLESQSSPPSSPPTHHRRSSSFVPDVVLASIENMGEVFHDVQEHMEEFAHDFVTFEELDEEELLARAEEEGQIEIDTLASDEAKEVVEHFIHPDDPMDPFTENEKLGLIPLAILVFYNVSGGPFGIESSVRAGGNFYALLGFLVMPFIWSIQEALVTAELGTAFPEASGGVAWVEEAFGESAGWMSGYLGWLAGATDNAIYPVLFLDYFLQSLPTSEEINPLLRFLFLALTSILLGYVNWKGLPLVGKMSSMICLVAMSPFIVLIVVGSFQVKPERWFQVDSADLHKAEEITDDDVGGGFLPDAIWGGILWRPFLNNLFWNLNSFDAAGSFAGEIDNPGKMFPRAMFLGVFLVVICYFFPLLIAIGASDVHRHEWTDGFLAKVTADVVGPWLGAWTVFAAGISNIALFQAELSADAFQLMGMADRGHLPKIFSKRSQHGTPTNGIILGTAVIVVLVCLSDFDQLVEMLNFNYALSLLLEYAAFIKLRISRPDLERPYRIPVNTTGAIILITPTVLMIFFVLGLATYTTYIFVICCNVVGILIFVGKQRNHNDDEIAITHEKKNEDSVATAPMSLDTIQESTTYSSHQK